MIAPESFATGEQNHAASCQRIPCARESGILKYGIIIKRVEGRSRQARGLVHSTGHPSLYRTCPIQTASLGRPGHRSRFAIAAIRLARRLETALHLPARGEGLIALRYVDVRPPQGRSSRNVLLEADV